MTVRHCAYLVSAPLNFLYIPLSVLPVVEISAAPITGKMKVKYCNFTSNLWHQIIFFSPEG